MVSVAVHIQYIHTKLRVMFDWYFMYYPHTVEKKPMNERFQRQEPHTGNMVIQYIHDIFARTSRYKYGNVGIVPAANSESDRAVEM